jgi:hypothetical protein
MLNLRLALEERFPLLASLRLHQGPSVTESFASFVGIMLAGLEKNDGAPLCFVFPRKDSLAAISAVLYALGNFAADFPALAELYAKEGFRTGQRVKLNPTGKIFEFGGVWQDHEAMFKLNFLNEKASSAWPVTEILRLEPTDRQRPKGTNLDCYMARNFASPSLLDELIGTRTFGNASLARNRVLSLSGKAYFDEFLSTTSLTNLAAETSATLDALVRPGHIDHEGNVRHQDQYQASGEPLLATTSRLDYLAAACQRVSKGSKVVIIDGASRITDLACFDLIAETQNLIIFAEAGEEEKLAQLRDRGCQFWPVSLGDMELSGDGLRGGDLFEPVFRAARNKAQLRIEITDCVDQNLEMCCSALNECHKELDESEGDETRNVVGQLFSLLTKCASLLSAPSPSEQQALLERLGELTQRAEERVMWIGDRPAAMLRQACGSLANAIRSTNLGEAKGQALRSLLVANALLDSKGIGIVVRSAAQQIAIRSWMESERLTFRTMLPSKVEGFFDTLICPIWPNGVNFGKVVNRQATPLIQVIAYAFERDWAKSFERKNSRSWLPSLEPSEKARILNVNVDARLDVETLASVAVPVESNNLAQDFEEIFSRRAGIRFAAAEEDTVSARLVAFSGDAYAFLTENSRTPVVTSLIAGTVEPGYKVPRRRVGEIQVGDVLAFRDGGRRDVIQAMADAQIGSDAPTMREVAARWHKALRDSQLDEDALVRELAEVNCPRTYQTVRAWLTDDAMIGPQAQADLEAIAYALGDHALLEQVPQIWSAIHRLRSEHLSAGMRLSHALLERLPKDIGESWTGQARIQIDNTTNAWLVQVESIEDRSEQWSRFNVNTILWKTDGV